MITGFNTDVEHDGVVYHVQTEDKGLDSPLILSLVYSGGAILASKRSRYEDLIDAGFDEAALTQRLKRQHRLICAAINAGRIDELKRMGEAAEKKEPEVDPPASDPTPAAPIREPSPAPLPVEEPSPTPVPVSDPPAAPESESEAKEKTSAPAAAAVQPTQPPPSAYTVYDSRRHESTSNASAVEEGLVVLLIDEPEFRAGESVDLQILVEERTVDNSKIVANAAVSVKILGTTFRPQLHSLTTNKQGIATVTAQIPNFQSGRAAVVIRVDSPAGSCETRRVIYPSK